jgi:hypothetical protein
MKQSKIDEAKILYSTPTVKKIDLVGETLRYPLFKVTSISCNYSIPGANHGEELNNIVRPGHVTTVQLELGGEVRVQGTVRT